MILLALPLILLVVLIIITVMAMCLPVVKENDKEEIVDLSAGKVKKYVGDISEEKINNPVINHIPNPVGVPPETQLPQVDMPRVQLV